MRRLRQHFLPKKWNPTGTYREREFDRVRAYRILCHAEVEFFVENLLLDLVEAAYAEWQNNRTPSYVMLCLIAASKIGWHDLEGEDLDLERIDPPKIRKDDTSIQQIIERSVEQYRKIVKDNNGVKEQNLKLLVMPVGVALSDLDATWIANMSSFGGQRGSVAHTSRLGLRHQIDPRTEKATVDALLAGLKDFDAKVASL